jgi:hypothetical protein
VTLQPSAAAEERPAVYHVRRVPALPPSDARWEKYPWTQAPALTVGRFMGARPEHAPRTQAKLAWDKQALGVIFRVEDRYVRAVARKHQDCVCTDSCVECFFAPGPDVSRGYFNIEINCGGVMLFHFQTVPRRDNRPVAPADAEQVTIAHTLPRRVEPEIPDPTVWTVEYRVPFAILGNYLPVSPPAPGTRWRANFFKCADATSHPHWLTWAFVDRPRPDFHVPEAFGELRFD